MFLYSLLKKDQYIQKLTGFALFKVFKEPKVDQEIYTRLIPSLISFGIHDHILSLKNKLKNLTKAVDEESENPAEVKNVEVKPKKEKQSKKKSKSKKVEKLLIAVCFDYILNRNNSGVGCM